MARKTKTSKKTQENNDSTSTDSADVVEAGPVDSSVETESDLTEVASDTADTSAEPSHDETLDEAAERTADDPADEAVSDVSEGAASSDDVNTDTPDDAEAAETDIEAALDADADPVDTTVAGVVPAQSDDPTPSAQPAPAPPAPAPSPSTLPLVFGGILAGAAGFLVATFAVPEGWPNPPSEEPAVVEVPVPDTETIARVDALTGDLAALAERLDTLPQDGGDTIINETVDLTPVIERLDAIESDTGGLRDAVSALEQSAADLSARVDEVAAQPAIVSPDGSAAMEAQLETFRRDLDAVTEAARAEIEEAQSRASQIEADAAAAAAEAARNTAMAEVRAALESGEPFADALDALGGVPEALANVAADGVTPMSALQGSFPDVARAALQEVQSVPEEASATDRMASFLRRHTNARSLAPRDGDDPDAVLSRAEAALSSGDLAVALAELDTLPEGATAALQGWIGEARSRAAAVAAMNEME